MSEPQQIKLLAGSSLDHSSQPCPVSNHYVRSQPVRAWILPWDPPRQSAEQVFPLPKDSLASSFPRDHQELKAPTYGRNWITSLCGDMVKSSLGE